MRHGVVISFRILEKWESTSLQQLPVLINNVFPTTITPSILQEQQMKHQSIIDIGRYENNGDKHSYNEAAKIFDIVDSYLCETHLVGCEWDEAVKYIQ